MGGGSYDAVDTIMIGSKAFNNVGMDASKRPSHLEKPLEIQIQELSPTSVLHDVTAQWTGNYCFITTISTSCLQCCTSS
jgi:hypothetical protein